MRGVRRRQDFGDIEDRTCGHALSQEPFTYFPAVAICENALEDFSERDAILDALRVGREPWIFREAAAPEEIARHSELSIVADTDK
jgi:hypothetical protein